jgi:benzodiazapine receptor
MAAAVGVMLVVAYAAASGIWVQSGSEWYLSLKRPRWQPPDIVFGLIWPYNFMVLGIAMVVVAQRLPERQLAIAVGLFAVSVAAATLWSYWFYGLHELGLATAALVAAALVTLPLLIVVFTVSALLGWLLVPYQLWLVTAASLSWGYWHLN